MNTGSFAAQARRRAERRVRRRVARVDPATLDGLRAHAAVTALFALAPRYANPRGLKRTQGTIEFRISDPSGRARLHTMVLAGGACRMQRGALAEPDLTLQLSVADLFGLVLGRADPLALALRGRLRIAGDLDLAMRLPRCFRL